MCGICGYTGTPDHPTLMRMTGALEHRGPDGGGFWETNDVSLGMRRLAIIDLDTGRQPVFNEDGTIAVIFNGEIYNHPELRAGLELAGHRFRTHHSDTEVLVHLYEEYGDDFLHKLNGMFAIALWDQKRKRLLLARDRAGIKPLYFAQAAGRLIFASEPKSILLHQAIRREPDYAALYHYFSFKNIPAPWSAFRGIEQLRPGERAVWVDGSLTRDRWWRVRFREDAGIGERAAAERIADLLEDSVRLCMRSDVPFGAYLSGGVDSSSVVALMSKLGGKRVKTFSLVYADEFPNKADDQAHARRVASRFDTEHHEYVLTCDEVTSHIDAVLGAFDEPFSGVTSTYFITRLIAQHVKVALSGDGADELFGSYLAHRLAQPLHHFERLGDHLPRLSAADRQQLSPYAEKPELLAEMLALGDEPARRAGLYLWADRAKRELFTPKMLELCAGADTGRLIRDAYSDSGTGDPLNRALYCDFNTLLPDQVLAFVDRLSMAHSVEVRPPFLDHRLIEFAATLPGALKIRQGQVKYILKQAVRGLIPDEVINRPKEGFVLPIDHWLLNNLRTFVEATLAPERLASHGLVHGARVRAILDAHYSKAANHGPRIWNLLMFQLWWERYFAG